MSETTRVAVAQMAPRLGELAGNIAALEERILSAGAAGAGLLVAPECATSGYVFESKEEGLASAIELGSPELGRLGAATERAGIAVVVGFLERRGSLLHNSAALFSKGELVGVYRKTHLPGMGVDRFVDAGEDPFLVHSAAGLRIGMLICYDGVFPEPPRVLALAGADVVVLPTNWPKGMEAGAEHLTATRALENTMYFVASNRVGTERYVTFIGRSSIAAPSGEIVAIAGTRSEEMIYGEIDPTISRGKHIVRIPGKAEINRIEDRRPAMYHKIIE